MCRTLTTLMMMLVIAAPHVVLAQDDDDPIDLDLDPILEDKKQPSAAPAAPDVIGDAKLGTTTQILKPTDGLAGFDVRMHLDEPGIAPPGSISPMGVLGGAGSGDDLIGPATHWPLWPALAAAGVGVVTLGIGAYMLSIDGEGTNCSGEPQPDLYNCMEVYNTAGAGTALTVMGIASLAASGVLLYMHLSTRPAARPENDEGVAAISLAPMARGGVVVGASGRF